MNFTPLLKDDVWHIVYEDEFEGRFLYTQTFLSAEEAYNRSVELFDEYIAGFFLPQCNNEWEHLPPRIRGDCPDFLCPLEDVG